VHAPLLGLVHAWRIMCPATSRNESHGTAPRLAACCYCLSLCVYSSDVTSLLRLAHPIYCKPAIIVPISNLATTECCCSSSTLFRSTAPATRNFSVNCRMEPAEWLKAVYIMETKIWPHWLLGQDTKQSNYHHTISLNPLFGLWMHSFSPSLRQR